MYLSSIRSIDLHGMDRITAKITVDEFITDLIRLKEDKGVIIHGIGTGILRKEVATYLKQDRRVKEYKLDFMNPGCTIVVIEPDRLTKWEKRGIIWADIERRGILMYTEEYDKRPFPFRDFLLKFIIIVIFALFLIWLIPKFISPKTSKQENSSSKVFQNLNLFYTFIITSIN